jgi:nitrate reductase gamma subunit
MRIILFLAAYIVYAAFWYRVVFHALVWLRATGRYDASPALKPGQSARICAVSALDLLLFRKLFESGKVLWLGSWIFHVSFVFVILRHLRYFLSSVPACITFIQPAGVVAGYTLPASLFYLMLLRLLGRKRYVSKYVSYYNFFLLGLLFSISATGLVMHLYLVPDLPGVKEFILGILAFKPAPVPGSVLFVIHFILVLFLVPYLPTHIFSAPLVIIEARKREEGLRSITHGE